METKANKKGFTLIELIIVIAIMAVLVALLAPNVLKYLEKSKVNKDINTLDSVLTAISAEMTDENLYKLNTTPADDTSGKIVGKKLSALKNLSNVAGGNNWRLLYQRLTGKENASAESNPNSRVLNDDFFEEVDGTSKVFGSKATHGAHIQFFIDGNGGVAVAAVDKDGNIVKYDGSFIAVSKNIDLAVSGGAVTKLIPTKPASFAPPK